MNGMPPAQSFLVDQRVVKAIETLEFFGDVPRVESILYLAQCCLIRLVEKVPVTKNLFSQLLFQRLLETKLLRAAQSEPIEAITHIAGEQFVSALTRQDHRHAALPRCRRKRHRASVISLLHRRLTVINH